MTALNDRKLVLLIRYVPSLIVAVFAALAAVAFVHDSNIKAKQSIDSLSNNLMTHQKEVIELQVDRIYKNVEFSQSQTTEELKQQAKQRVNEAHQIATHIYQKNPDKSKAEITKMISDALEPIRFYNGRGYFFIFQMDGVNVMHALKPYLKGKSAWNSMDIKGTYILREHIKRIEQNGGEAFYRWWYQKPDYPVTQEFEKIGFGQAFTPYNWFIGTGEYVADVEKDVKSDLLRWISTYQKNQEEKVFIFDQHGEILVHEDSVLIGQNISTVSPYGNEFEQLMGSLAEGGGDFMVTSDSNDQQVTFLRKYGPWDWYIGSSFSVSEFQTYLDEQRRTLEENNATHLLKLMTISLIATILMIILSYLVTQLIVRRFDKFQKRISEDFGRLEQTKDQLQYMAMHDPLTGLSNRASLLETIRCGIEVSQRNDQNLAVAFLDLDDFKKVNDLYGHSVGDKLLECLSRKFESILEEGDSVSRFGGDEFIFCFPCLEDQAHAGRKLNRLSEVFRESLIIDGRKLTTEASVGVSMYPLDSDDPETLITNADIVLYRTKMSNKGSTLFFDEQLTEQIKQEYRIEEALRQARSRNELQVFYQPQLDASKEQLVSVEALIRWNSESLGPVAPDNFIPLAERTGMINDIGMFVIKRACQDILTLSPNGRDALKLSINISPRQLLQETFAQELVDAIDEIGIDVSRLTLEVTESMPISDLVKITPVLQELKLLGFSISLDDFGTGYSSLSHLNALPIDELKIDRSFVSKMSENAQSNALVKAIMAIGDSYQLTVVAEGVETKEQQLMLKNYGCDLLQGYYYSKPISIQELHSWSAGQEQA